MQQYLLLGWVQYVTVEVVCASALVKMHFRCPWDCNKEALLHPVFPWWHYGVIAKHFHWLTRGIRARGTQAAVNESICSFHKCKMMGLGQCEEWVKTNLYDVSSRGRNQTHRARSHGDQPYPIAVKIGGKYDDDDKMKMLSLREL